MSELKIGQKGFAEEAVTVEKCASHVGSGDLRVYATPMMVALMEKASYTSVQDALKPGQSTVGISIDVKHNAATPAGMTVRAESELVEIDRRKLTFRVTVFDDEGDRKSVV